MLLRCNEFNAETLGMIASERKEDRRSRILLVDDDTDLRAFLALEFSDWDYIVTEATNGKDAIEKILLSAFDLIVTDVKMPRLGGLELLSHVRRCFPRIPVILMTAFGGSIPVEARDCEGAFALIFKPIVLKELHELVTRALNQQEGQP